MLQRRRESILYLSQVGEPQGCVQPSCWAVGSASLKESCKSCTVSQDTGFCAWTSIWKLLQGDSSLLDIHLKSCKTASHSSKGLVWITLSNWLQISLFLTVEHEELVWCTKASFFLPRPCLFTGSCPCSCRNTDLGAGRFWMAKPYWVSFCTKTAVSLLAILFNNWRHAVGSKGCIRYFISL